MPVFPFNKQIAHFDPLPAFVPDEHLSHGEHQPFPSSSSGQHLFFLNRSLYVPEQLSALTNLSGGEGNIPSDVSKQDVLLSLQNSAEH